jgi:Kef-type K+ transport system membrane component KefB/nucleotide-binding universal stress UspA family protein
MKRYLLFYFILAIVAIIIFCLVICFGNHYFALKHLFIDVSKNIENGASLFSAGLFANIHKSLGTLLMQIVIIILIVRLVGFLFQKFGQPVVLGEILAGILLGPSVLGEISPKIMHFVFPSESLGNLNLLSHIGLILFMFVIGMELDWASIRKSARDAVLISYAGLVLPFILGVILSFFLFSYLVAKNESFLAFSLFLGTVMCITAFPVLARIVQEKQLTRDSVGKMAITIAAIGDVTAWCMLAVVIAFVKAGAATPALITIGLAALYVIIMLFVVRPFIQRVGAIYATRERISKPVVALVFLILIISSFLSEIIGIHALFGAFMAGVIMPDNINFKQIITEKIQDLALVLLLPLFFVETGLRTNIGLINSSLLWGLCLIIICVAFVGKFGGTILASRFVRLNWQQSLTLGVLMNSKGLMELVVINIGYELEILSAELYSMLVFMTLVTTFMTGPGLNLVQYFYRERLPERIITKATKVILSFANPRMGGSLLKISKAIVPESFIENEYVALHLSTRTDLSPDDAIVFEKESFAPILKTAKSLDIQLRTIYKNIGGDVATEIIRTCRNENPDFILLGGAYSIFSSDLLGGVIRKVINEVNCDVLVFSERKKILLNTILLVLYGNGDDFLIRYANNLIKKNNQKCYIFPAHNSEKQIKEYLNNSGFYPEIIRGHFTEPDFLENIDMILISTENWKKLETEYSSLIKYFPSVLYVHKGNVPNRILNRTIFMQ